MERGNQGLNKSNLLFSLAPRRVGSRSQTGTLLLSTTKKQVNKSAVAHSLSPSTICTYNNTTLFQHNRSSSQSRTTELYRHLQKHRMPWCLLPGTFLVCRHFQDWIHIIYIANLLVLLPVCSWQDAHWKMEPMFSFKTWANQSELQTCTNALQSCT